MANNVDPDQTAPLGAVWSGSTLFAQTYMSENLDHYGRSCNRIYNLQEQIFQNSHYKSIAHRIVYVLHCKMWQFKAFKNIINH